VRVAFYAPLKAPSHGTPSGDRRVAALYVEALQHAGHRVELVSSFSSYDNAGDSARQVALRTQGLALAAQLGKSMRPDVWFTYHVYYKAPTGWARISAARSAFPTSSPKHRLRRSARTVLGKLAMTEQGEAIRHADLLICPTRFDIGCLETLVSDRSRIVLLSPFLDVQPFEAAVAGRDAHRKRLAAEHRADTDVPWIVVAAMMREGDKAESFHQLADVLERISDVPWQLLVAGDGPARTEIAHALEAVAPGRVRLLGTLGAPEVAALYAAGDLCIWPACNEAYGMAMLEAQAAGVPVLSCAHRGVPDVVASGRTGLLAPSGDTPNPGALRARVAARFRPPRATGPRGAAIRGR
jgi:glycosyltransferase involved in cell wall biosynthesis